MGFHGFIAMEYPQGWIQPTRPMGHGSRLPDVNNMCRIRALEARTRSSAGEKAMGWDGGSFTVADPCHDSKK